MALIKCPECGKEVSDKASACPQCAYPIANLTPKEDAVSQSSTCVKCESSLEDGQEFCTKCGQKATLILDSNIENAINSVNASIGKKKSNKKLIVVFIAIAPAIAVAGIVLLIFWNAIFPFGGKYESGGSSYNFADGKYTYTSSDNDTHDGTYEVKDNEILLKDSDGDETTFIKDGNYILEKGHGFEEDIVSGKAIDQTFNYSRDVKTDYGTYTFSGELKLSKDGSYSWQLSLSSSYFNNHYENGTYVIDGNIIKLTPKDENYIHTWYIYNKKIYDSVYVKK